MADSCFLTITSASAENQRIQQLIRDFEALSSQPPSANTDPVQPTDPGILAPIEEKKLELILEFEAIIRKKMPEEYSLPQQKKPKPATWLKPRHWEMLYYFVLVFGMFESIAESYLFGSELFTLIPGISNLTLFTASFVFTVLSSILFYAFEVSFIKEALGFPDGITVFAGLIDTCSRQVKSAKNINDLLRTAYIMSIDQTLFDDYRKLVKLINEDLRNKQANPVPYPESVLNDIMNFGVIAFGALSSVAGSYFFAHYMMALMAASLIGTPLGWAIIALTALSGLGFYYAMDATSMVRMVYPAYEEYDALCDELEQFRETYKDDLLKVTSIKNLSIFAETGRMTSTSLERNEPEMPVNRPKRGYSI